MTGPGFDQVVQIPADGVRIEGMLEVPADASGLVLFAHGSGSSRHSPRNNLVARQLRGRRLGTLLMDLLTVAEDQDYANRFDIGLVTRRLLAVTRWARQEQRTRDLRIGYFGASTGAAAALEAAAGLGDGVGAVVSRGGRPDLAGADALARVVAPTLLLVGGLDTLVLQLNRDAYARLACPKELTVIPGASHLFEEPGALDQVAARAGDWFARHLTG